MKRDNWWTKILLHTEKRVSNSGNGWNGLSNHVISAESLESFKRLGKFTKGNHKWK